MISPRVWRPLALAGVFGATMGAATANAQTVVLRGVPPGSAVELVQDGGAPVTATANAAGDATMKGSLSAPGEVRVNFYVDVCASVRRVLIVTRDGVPPALPDGCERKPLAGLFVIRPISTIVVDVSGIAPSILLRQGPYDLRPAKDWSRSPSGLIVFGGGGYSWLGNAEAVACGDVAQCPGNANGAAFTGGVAYWVSPYFGVEASYLKPAKALFEGAVNGSLFRTSLETHVGILTAKVGLPLGPIRLYGQGGATYHRAKLVSVQDAPDLTQDQFDMRTAGWGWTFGGGIEAWVAPAVAIYGEGGRAALKGGGVETGGEGRLDERMTYVVFGLRVSLRR